MKSLPGRKAESLILPTAAAPAAASAPIATAPATAAITTAAAAAAALGLGSCFVDYQRAPLDVLAVHGCDGCLGFLFATHFHETESLGSASVPVHDHLGGLHRAMGLKHLLQFPIPYLVRQVSYIQL